MIFIKIKELSKEFKTIRKKIIALNNISLEIEKGEFFVILGPSGCGKSTLLNILAGLEKPTKGEIWFGEKLVCSTEKRIFLSSKERNVSMVFQSYALYPHLNVYDNIAFPLKIAKISKKIIKEKVTKMAKMLAIDDLLEAKPKELSGGQRQRVAIARALVRHPSLFLLDEPLSNLDAQLRIKMREELKNLQQKLGITTIYVTHDQTEAMTLGDRLAILKKGKIQQIGKPLEVYKKPANIFVASFMGTPPMNLIKTEIFEESGNFYTLIDKNKFKIYIDKKELKEKEIILGIRPEDIKIVEEKTENSFEEEIKHIEHLGTEIILHFKIGENKLLVKLTEDKGFKKGKKIRLFIDPKKIYIFKSAEMT
ncbi:MAG TPA: ABC transporter ATP-binding protein [Candidatus Desulfofervidus auxilii]|uniref:ABC transporter ATP-binding protein n=1 Tax=Desulfofervidus auxilii TaxID=1621989 RepID=A0A7C0Y369_DESA2|nr:ABC transporter ATP-binding protein [Candidatus Desulfofervidus auxilii]